MSAVSELSLVKAALEDAPRVAEIMRTTAEGMLELVFAPLMPRLGFNSLDDGITWLFNDRQGIFNLDYVRLLKLQVQAEAEPEIVGLCYAYPQALHQHLLPEIIKRLVPESSVRLLTAVMPQERLISDALQSAPNNSPVPRQGLRLGRVLDAVKGRSVKEQGRALYLNTLWVSSALRGLHLGTLLLRDLKESAAAAGFERLCLHCFNDNLKALDFYKAQGFVAEDTCLYPEGLLTRHPLGGSILCLELNGKAGSLAAETEAAQAAGADESASGDKLQAAKQSVEEGAEEHLSAGANSEKTLSADLTQSGAVKTTRAAQPQGGLK